MLNTFGIFDRKDSLLIETSNTFRIGFSQISSPNCNISGAKNQNAVSLPRSLFKPLESNKSITILCWFLRLSQFRYISTEFHLRDQIPFLVYLVCFCLAGASIFLRTNKHKKYAHNFITPFIEHRFLFLFVVKTAHKSYFWMNSISFLYTKPKILFNQ